MMTTEEPLTRRQQRLTDDLRRIESQIATLQNRKREIQTELDRIWPQVHREAIRNVPKDDAIVISVFNYTAQGYTGQVTTNAVGVRVVTDMKDDSLKLVDYSILALCTRAGGANLTRLLAVKQLNDLGYNLKSRVHRLARRGFIDIQFEKA